VAVAAAEAVAAEVKAVHRAAEVTALVQRQADLSDPITVVAVALSGFNTMVHDYEH
jgi:hypothetical protein